MADRYTAALQRYMRFRSKYQDADNKAKQKISDWASLERRLSNFTGSAKQQSQLRKRVQAALEKAQAAERARDTARVKMQHADNIARQLEGADYRRQLREDTRDAISRGDRSAAAVRRVPIRGRRAERKYLESQARNQARNATASRVLRTGRQANIQSPSARRRVGGAGGHGS